MKRSKSSTGHRPGKWRPPSPTILRFQAPPWAETVSGELAIPVDQADLAELGEAAIRYYFATAPHAPKFEADKRAKDLRGIAQKVVEMARKHRKVYRAIANSRQRKRRFEKSLKRKGPKNG